MLCVDNEGIVFSEKTHTNGYFRMPYEEKYQSLFIKGNLQHNLRMLKY